MTPTKATTIIRLSAATCALALAAAIVARRADDWPLRLLYAGLLAVIVVTDLERCIIPNAITLPGTALAVLARGWPSVAGALVGLSIVAAPALALWLAPGKSTPLGVPHPWESHTPGTSQGHGAWGWRDDRWRASGRGT